MGLSLQVPFYLGIWICVSACMIIFNASLLSSFRHPIWLTFWHQLVSTILILCVRFTRPALVATGDEKAGLPPLTILRAIEIGLPVAFAQCVGLMTGNIAIMHISVSFAQMVKAWTPACVYSIGCLMGNQQFSAPIAKTILIITFGLSVTSFGELNFNAFGFCMQVAALMSEGVRINMLEVRLKSQGYKLNPLTSIQVFAPMASIILLICALVFDKDAITWEVIESVGKTALVANGLIAFVLNIAIYMAIQVASGLVFTLAGVIKDVVIITGSVIMFGTSVSTMQLLGYVMAMAGLQTYGIVSKDPASFEDGLVCGMWRWLEALWTPPNRSEPLPVVNAELVASLGAKRQDGTSSASDELVKIEGDGQGSEQGP